ncbi:MAG TPA: BrxA/BrxB family bacilliredoxin [Flavobacteriales bacterium]|nr:BrxA/BrxB family bacilliredoxin [Flavobacteriales bacterium]HRE73870.1 BrxA/BrxB family bacilliredoxin [Flavobacteriales bacterium]HRE98405.1 BrxA/BrxB family bacilliredoxin [Flavobacteriales bacterium]HRJ34527.1 BrxA/BrxB family bacilliredoxin [Flavobacteriales bacterium]HRJ39734.1 BrxA/BrxB family bacilliredoxin [Flavobacteriales bacterium]
MYPPELVAPMKKELVDAGFKELLNAGDVDNEMKNTGTTLVVVNSVCGCAAGAARPGVRKAVQNAKIPAHLTTVFAGVDRDAVEQARRYMLPYPPSSPCIALFKDGKLVHFLERHHIEGRSADMIAENLQAAFDEFC